MCFRELETLLSTRYYTMKLLPIKSRSQIFVPMIEMLDHLLVMGVIQSETDIQRLLCLLNPERLAPSNAASKKSLSLPHWGPGYCKKNKTKKNLCFMWYLYTISESVPLFSCLCVDAGRWRLGLLSAEVTSEEDMKLALCNLLQHLCDCQVCT